MEEEIGDKLNEELGKCISTLITLFQEMEETSNGKRGERSIKKKLNLVAMQVGYMASVYNMLNNLTLEDEEDEESEEDSEKNSQNKPEVFDIASKKENKTKGQKKVKEE